MTSDLDVLGRLDSLAGEYGLHEAAQRRLAELLDLLADPSAPTAIHDPRAGVEQHVADSLVALELPELRAAKRIADLGAGAGVPGLVLAIALPDCAIVLVESSSRKCRFLQRAAERLELARVSVACTRIEAWAAGQGSCDVVCARALASLPVLCEYAAPLLVDEGVLVAWKAEVDAEEALAGDAASAVVGLAPVAVRTVHPFPQARHRTLYVYRKVAPTPARFPRRPGIATKRPISATS